jgi:methylmalonyl-CoA mutase cobalamin-binding domain/chain
MNQMINEMKNAIVAADVGKVSQLLMQLTGSYTKDEVFCDCIDPALDTLCLNIQSKNSAIPELLMSLKQVHRIVEVVEGGSKPRRKQRILIGVVEGDIHDMGKNIIRDVCIGYGFDVVDMGRNVSVGSFVETVLEQQVDIACLSTMMSTTIESLAVTISQLKSTKPGIKVLVGGAFVNEEIADRINADGYARNASTIMSEINRVLQ